MNQIYLLRSQKFSGFIKYTFNEEGILLGYDTSDAALSSEQLSWLAERMPRQLPEFKAALNGSKTYKLELLKAEAISFEQFWTRYNEKTRSSKKKALNCWNRLSQTNRDKAYAHIVSYERSIPNGIAKKYAETYLNAELWNN